jgi:hypothetical protein
LWKDRKCVQLLQEHANWFLEVEEFRWHLSSA